MKIMLRFKPKYADSVEWLGMTADEDFYELGAIVNPIDFDVVIEVEESHWKSGAVRNIAKEKYDILGYVR